VKIAWATIFDHCRNIRGESIIRRLAVRQSRSIRVSELNLARTKKQRCVAEITTTQERVRTLLQLWTELSEHRVFLR